MPTFREYVKKAIVNTAETEEVVGTYDPIKDWKNDPKGYFLIRINRETNKIEVGFCPTINRITHKFIGNKPQDVYFAITERGLISRLDHAAYLGKELEKAYLALKYGYDYIQDEEFVVKSNIAFHLLSSDVIKEVGSMDSKLIYDKWLKWLKNSV